MQLIMLFLIENNNKETVLNEFNNGIFSISIYKFKLFILASNILLLFSLFVKFNKSYLN